MLSAKLGRKINCYLSDFCSRSQPEKKNSRQGQLLLSCFRLYAPYIYHNGNQVKIYMQQYLRWKRRNPRCQIDGSTRKKASLSPLPRQLGGYSNAPPSASDYPIMAYLPQNVCSMLQTSPSIIGDIRLIWTKARKLLNFFLNFYLKIMSHEKNVPSGHCDTKQFVFHLVLDAIQIQLREKESNSFLSSRMLGGAFSGMFVY